MVFSTRVLDKVVLGHNPLFGVDHLSTSRGQAREMQFSNTGAIQKLILAAVDFGASGMMMSTHPRSLDVLRVIAANPEARDSLNMYPLVPYAQKYVTMANEKGWVNSILDTLNSTTLSEKSRLLISGARALLGNRVRGLIEGLLEIELSAFRKSSVRAIFLHDICTDLILGLNLKDVLMFFIELIETKYKCKAAFATKNPVRFLKCMQTWGIKSPIILIHLNKIGFSMNPSRLAVEQAIAETDCHVMAMSALASGFLRPDDAFRYLGELGTVESATVGVSSQTHIEETFGAINRYLI